MRPNLYYFSHGSRAYASRPVRSYRRPHWEFQAVIEGRIAVLRGERAGPYEARKLWVFEAGCEHGWSGVDGEEAEIIVFHLPRPVPVLQRVVRNKGGWLNVPLGSAEIRWLIEQRERLRQDWARPTEQTALKVTHLMSGLSLMVLERSSHESAGPMINPDRERVEKALYWYRQNVAENPGVESVARAVGISAVHLRRLFQAVRGQSPKRAFQKIRMEQAREALMDPRLTVESAAAHFNFADASSFSRAYRSSFGQSPRREKKS